MNNLTTVVKNFIRDEEGTTTVEYALAGTLVTLGAVTFFTHMQGIVIDRIDLLTRVVFNI